MIFRKKCTNFLFLLINRFFLLNIKWKMDPKSEETNDSLSASLKKVGGGPSPLSPPPSYAHGSVYTCATMFGTCNFQLLQLVATKIVAWYYSF